MEKKVEDIIKKALDGGQITGDELKTLLAVNYLSEESFVIQYASRKMSAEASKGKAEVHAQMGINIGSCPKDCQFCSFAVMNKVFTETKKHPLDEIVENALKFEADGANAIYLMTTAEYDFQDYLAVAKEVRAALKTEVPLIANFGDFEEEEAKALKKAGFTGVYHAVRMGEGTVTNIEPRIRLRTMKAAKNAGLLLGTGVEPIGPEHTLDELAEKALIVRDFAVGYFGAARRVVIPTSPLAKYGLLNFGQMAHILAAVKLAAGYKVIGNCTHEPNVAGAMAGSNVFWAEVGSNPRDTAAETVRGWTVQRTQDVLKEAGWEILQGPSRMYSEQ